MSIKNNTASLQQLLEVVNNLPDAGSGGIELPDLTNPASADEIFLNKEVIDENGKVKTGTFTIDNEINTQEDLLSELRAALNGKAGGGEQVAPEISVNANGLITATAGTKSSTYQMAFQPAKTITPSTASQVAVSSGYYTGGNITVAAVPTQSKSATPTATAQNIVPDSGKFLSKVTVNAIPSSYVIPSGTLTIKENGTHDVKNYASATVEIAGGSGEQVEWSANEDALVTGSLSSYYNDRVTSICSHVFNYCNNLTSVNFPAVTIIGYHAFNACSNLTAASFPACTTIGNNAFNACSNLTSVSFPACTTIGNNAFGNCKSLTMVNFPKVTTIEASAFYNCYNLTTASFSACMELNGDAYFGIFNRCVMLTSLYLMNSKICKLDHSNHFTSTPIGGYSASAGTYGSIYVPASLVSAYQSATNWVYFSSRITAIPSDY